MVKRFHYDDVIYQNWLAERLSEKEHAVVTAHLEECENCQEKLESISSGEVSWNEVQSYLRSEHVPSKPESSVAVGLVDRAKAGSSKSDYKHAVAVRFLEPSDELDSLGRFDRYEIVEILGRGGMGIVMKGFDPSLDRYSAIKVLAPELATSAAARQRFFREAKSAAAVIHDHVVPIQTVDEWEGLPYLLMPVVEGKSLQHRVIDQQGALQLPEVLRIGSQVAAGLAAAHAQGLVHRDVKPANVLLENGVERVMISDFGLARAADDANVTRSQVISGTPQYMSPEHARGGEIDCRADLFSLGSVLYFMCCGHSPFRASTTMGVLHRIVNDDPRSIRQVNSEIPTWLSGIIERLLEKAPDDRFQSAEEVSLLLGRWLAHVQQPDAIAPPLVLKRNAQHSSVGWPPIAKWFVALAVFGFFAAALAIIILEANKGTITIQSASDDTKIRIKRGDTIVKELTVTKGEASTRIAAGEYLIEIDGRADEFSLENGSVELKRGGEWFAKVVESSDGIVGDSSKDDSNVGKASDVAKTNNTGMGPSEIPGVLMPGIEAFQAAKYEKAIAEFRQVFDEAFNANPKQERIASTALYYLWCSYRSKDDLVKSIEIQDQLLHDFPTSHYLASTKYFRGLNLYHLGKVEEANRSWQAVLKGFPNSQEAQFSKSMLKHAVLQGKLRKGSANQKERNKLVKGMEDVTLENMAIDRLASIAGWEFGQGRIGEAERLYKIVLERESEGPWVSDALIHLANCSIRKRYDEGAIGYLDEWFKRFPGHSGTSMNLFLLGDCQSRLGMDVEAKKTWEQLLEEYPNSTFAAKAKAGLEDLR